MFSDRRFEYDQLQQLLGARDERIRQLELQLAKSQKEYEFAAREWHRLQRHRQDLAEWLVDLAIDESEKVVNPLVDAGLGGEYFVPCSFCTSFGSSRYQLDLVSTEYTIRRVPSHG